MKVCAECGKITSSETVTCECGGTRLIPIIICTTCYGKQCYKIGNGKLIKSKCTDCGLGEEE